MNNKKIAISLVAVGLGINIADAITAAGDPSKGLFYGDNGMLKSIARYSPVSPGMLMALIGGAMLLFKK